MKTVRMIVRIAMGTRIVSRCLIRRDAFFDLRWMEKTLQSGYIGIPNTN